MSEAVNSHLLMNKRRNTRDQNKWHKSRKMEVGTGVPTNFNHYLEAKQLLKYPHKTNSKLKTWPRIDDVVDKLLSTASSATGFIPGLSRWICREGPAFRVLLLAGCTTTRDFTKGYSDGNVIKNDYK